MDTRKAQAEHQHGSDLKTKLSQLEKTNARLVQCLSLCTHDLKGPSQKISQYVELFEEDYSQHLDNAAQKYLDVIAGSASRSVALIQRMQDYATVLSSVPSWGEVDLTAVLRDVSAQVRAGSALRISSADLPVVTADTHLVATLFRELLTNSGKFKRADNDAVVDVSADQTGSEFTLSFQDNGVGMHPDKTEEILRPFVRLNGKFEYAGSGLGLTIADAICDMLGWTMRITGQPDEGTLVQLILPVQRLAAQAAD